jgi:pimeloyl-ACP methyl ester carboxylesterase
MYVKPLLDNPLRQSQVDSFVNAMNCEQTTSIYDALSELTVPTCIIWGDDDIFFPPEWADWLENVIPGVWRM